jgi:hypothetical protein
MHRDKKMQQLISRTTPKTPVQNAPRIAIQYLRNVVGVFKCMQEPKIEAIFVKEKQRMRHVIDGIDKTLPNHPVQITRGNTRTYAPWQPQDLGVRWDTFMDGVFETAKNKGTDFVKDNLKRLNDEYTSPDAIARAKLDSSIKDQKRIDEIAEWAKLRSDIAGYIAKLEAEWDSIKK